MNSESLKLENSRWPHQPVYLFISYDLRDCILKGDKRTLPLKPGHTHRLALNKLCENFMRFWNEAKKKDNFKLYVRTLMKH